MKTKPKPKPPTKRERDRAFVNHNVPQFIKSVERVQKQIRKLDCALAECHLYASLLTPIEKSEVGK